MSRTEFRYDWSPLNLSNRYSIYWPIFFLIIKTTLVALWTMTRHTTFWVDRTNWCVVIAGFFSRYSDTKWPNSTIYFTVTSDWPLIHLFPFKSYRHFSKSGSALYEHFGIQSRRSQLFVLYSWIYTLSRESFCTSLVLIGQKNIGAHKSRFLKSWKYPTFLWSNPRHVFCLS